MNLGLILEETVRRYPNKTAVSLGERKLSFAELDEASNKIANALIKMGLRKGDRAAILLSNSPEFAAIYFGIVKIGATGVPLDTRYKVSELASLFDNCQPRVIISESPCLEPVVSALPQFKSVEQVIDINSKYEGRFPTYQEITATSSAQRVEVQIEDKDIAHIAYTSGSTSRPRGIMLSHGSILAHAAGSTSWFQQTENDALILCALPLYHAFGLSIILISSVLKGSTVVMLPGLSISSLMETIEKERVTLWMGVPYTFALAVNAAERERVKHDLSSLRYCVAGGSALSTDTVRRFKQYYGLGLFQLWGLTEGVAHDTCQAIDGSGNPGSVGKPLPEFEVKIVDEDDQQLPPNQPGEVILSGPMMTGYYANPQATAEIIKDGWLYTGDIGRIDGDGELFILGRKKDIIIVKGLNINPIDIEDVLHTHPMVAEAAVVGIDDVLRGERIRAVVALKDGATVAEGELKDLCREQLANYKIPKEVIIIDSIPKTATGKINKEALRQL
ncbi:class I adenylate-forming enzyme family protein [Chloroflexota bacterium]